MDLVIEFQNSPISIDEMKSREAFYKRMIWILNSDKLNYSEEDFGYTDNSFTFESRLKKTALKEAIKAEEEFIQLKKKNEEELKPLDAAITRQSISNQE